MVSPEGHLFIRRIPVFALIYWLGLAGDDDQLMNALLRHCARPFCNEAQRRIIGETAIYFRAWETLPEEAEEHGLSPLLYHHLRQCKPQILPESERIKFQLLYLRHRRSNRIRMDVLHEILQAYQEEGIDVLVLKGGALCHLIYSEPALRPMRDLDLLVKPQDAERAQRLLVLKGFEAPKPSLGRRWLFHHLPEARKEQEGLPVSVEIHYNLFGRSHSISMSRDDIKRPLISFPIKGLTAFTLGYEDMLWHLCHHFVTTGEPLRLISVADIIGFAERFVEEIDWSLIRKQYPFVINTLAMVGLLTRPTEELRQRAGLNNSKVPRDIGVNYKGWPSIAITEAWKQPKGFWKLVVDSFSPPEWWLRLHYGLNDRQLIPFCRYVSHPLHLGKLALQRACHIVEGLKLTN